MIESSGISEPEQVAETFDSRLAEQMDAMGSIEGAPGLDADMIKVFCTARKLVVLRSLPDSTLL